MEAKDLWNDLISITATREEWRDVLEDILYGGYPNDLMDELAYMGLMGGDVRAYRQRFKDVNERGE